MEVMNHERYSQVFMVQLLMECHWHLEVVQVGDTESFFGRP